MNQYFTLDNKNEQQCRFNLVEFLATQRKIWIKYDNYNESLSYNTLTEKTFINNLDKYILHALEEVNESKDELFKNYDIKKEEYVEELIDVLMYCGTIGSILMYNIIELDKKDELKDYESIDFNILKIYDPKEQFFNLTYYITEARRPYSARKWHKPHKNVTHDDKIENIKHSFTNIKKAMTIILELLSICDLDFINEKINIKQIFVINL